MTELEDSSAIGEKNYPTCGAGIGKCKLHGGASSKNIKHGYYSKYLQSKLADKIDELANNEDLLDLRKVIAMQQALILDILGRIKEGTLTLDKGTIRVLNEIADKIGRNIERLNKIEVGEKYVLEIREVQNIVNQVVMIVQEEIKDQQVIKRIAGKLQEVKF